MTTTPEIKLFVDGTGSQALFIMFSTIADKTEINHNTQKKATQTESEA